jgi:hypothetical protein
LKASVLGYSHIGELDSRSTGTGTIRAASKVGNGNEPKPPPISPDARVRKAQLQQIIIQGKNRMENGQIRYSIAGHEFNLDEQIADAANFLLWGKSLVDEAIKASSEASLAWAGVCLALPLLTNPFQAREANEQGFVEITASMKYFTALEPTLLPKTGQHSHRNDGLIAVLTERLVELYQAILEYQMKSVLRFYKASLKRVISDIRDPTVWKGMVEKIRGIEKEIRRQLATANEDAMVTTLNELQESAADINKNMQKHLQIAISTKPCSRCNSTASKPIKPPPSTPEMLAARPAKRILERASVRR